MVDAVPQGEGLIWRELGIEDAEQVDALHRFVLGMAADPTLVKPEAPGFFVEILRERGLIVGVFAGEQLVSYGILQFILPAGDTTATLLGLPSGEGLGKLAGAAVHPAFRGRGLQSATIAWRLERAAQRGLRHLFSTAAPGNEVSWVNLMTKGFRVAALVEKYGGLLRYLLHRDATLPAASHAGLEWCAPQAVARQQALFAAGATGVAFRRDAGGRPQIGFALPAPRQPGAAAARALDGQPA